MTIDKVFESMTAVYNVVIGLFTNVITTITGNPLLYVPVLISMLGAIVLFAIGVIRKFGVSGVSSSGRGKRRR